MKPLRIFLLLMSCTLSTISSAYAQPLLIDQPVIITGKMATIKSLHPNPDFYGEKQIAIRPHNKLHIQMKDGRILKTQLIQLISANIPYRHLFAQEHKNVRLHC